VGALKFDKDARWLSHRACSYLSCWPIGRLCSINLYTILTVICLQTTALVWSGTRTASLT